MPVTPINVARVSQNLQSFRLLRTLQAGNLGLFNTQNQLATGLRFQTPSQAPAGAIASLRLDRVQDTLRGVESNLRAANAVLTDGEAAMSEAVSLIRETQALTSEAVNSSLSPDVRLAMVTTVNSLLDQMVTVGNREHLDTYLFSGLFGEKKPFELNGQGVVYHGDDGRLTTIVDSDYSQDSFTISGKEFFNAVSGAVEGWVDLNPQLTRETRITDLRGATGAGISLGRIEISDGTTTVDVDLTGSATVGDVLDRLASSLPATISASLSPSGINLNATLPSSIRVTDMGGGNTAVELGIFTNAGVTSVIGQDLNALLTPRTRLPDLLAGNGVNLAAGFTIRNGTDTATIDFLGAATVEDVLNRINQSGVGVWARISADGSRIDVLNRVSGADLRIEENGGGAATALGIRSMHAALPLSSLNDGTGVHSVAGMDFRITTASGANIDVDVNALNLGTATLQDMVNLLNAAGGGAITAGLATTGNGFTIRDNTSGGGTLTIARLNESPAIDGLGLNVTATGNQLRGADVVPIRVDSPFTALLELRAALEADDSPAITRAGERVERSMDHMQNVQGKLAAKAESMLRRGERIDNEMTATKVLQSDIRDVDMTEAIVRFQQMQTALQANLQTSTQVLGLSLLDYLR
jgi:flagellar hook-associated protein 3 FlgL